VVAGALLFALRSECTKQCCRPLTITVTTRPEARNYRQSQCLSRRTSLAHAPHSARPPTLDTPVISTARHANQTYTRPNVTLSRVPPSDHIPAKSHTMDPSNRATRPPPSRRALFHASTRRPTAPSVVRPDTATLYPQTMDDELVERDEKGEYKVNAPSSMYKHLAQMREADEEIGA
jgi:hypothetical protein